MEVQTGGIVVFSESARMEYVGSSCSSLACRACFVFHRALNLFNPFQERGLYELGDGTVALKCHRKFEKEAYVDMDPHFDALKCLEKLCRAIPVHIIWGERKNFVYGLDIVVRDLC